MRSLLTRQCFSSQVNSSQPFRRRSAFWYRIIRSEHEKCLNEAVKGISLEVKPLNSYIYEDAFLLGIWDLACVVWSIFFRRYILCTYCSAYSCKGVDGRVKLCWVLSLLREPGIEPRSSGSFWGSKLHRWLEDVYQLSSINLIVDDCWHRRTRPRKTFKFSLRNGVIFRAENKLSDSSTRFIPTKTWKGLCAPFEKSDFPITV